MNTQPDGHPTDTEILAAEMLGMDPWEVKRILDTWEQAFDIVEERWVKNAREGQLPG